MDVRLRIHAHPNEEMLEDYAFRRLSEADEATVEEHLFLCEDCQDQLRELDNFISAAKLALSEYPPDAAETGTAARLFWDRKWVPRKPMAAAFGASAIGLVAAAGMIAGMLLWRTNSAVPITSPAATVILAALRGGEETMARGPANRPLDLSIAPEQLPVSTGYRLAVISSAGKPEWEGAALVSGSRLSAHVETGLRAGVYWARLYDAKGELLREFGLRVGRD